MAKTLRDLKHAKHVLNFVDIDVLFCELFKQYEGLTDFIKIDDKKVMLGSYELTDNNGVNNKSSYVFIEDILSKDDVEWRVLEKVLINKYFNNMLFLGVGIYEYMDTLTYVYDVLDELQDLKRNSTTAGDFIPTMLSGFKLVASESSYYKLTTKMIQGLNRDDVFIKLSNKPQGINLTQGIDKDISINLGQGYTRNSILLSSSDDVTLTIGKSMIFSSMLNNLTTEAVSALNLMAGARALRDSLYLYKGV